MRNKYLSFTVDEATTPFISGEEAWFWYCLCEQTGDVKTHHDSFSTHRPCETSDIIIAVKKLFRCGKLKPQHLKILTKYGYSQVPPHPHFGDSIQICYLWREALSFLENLLRKKGIVAA